MYVYIYVYIITYIYIYTCVCIYIHVYVYIYIHVCIYNYIYIYVYVGGLYIWMHYVGMGKALDNLWLTDSCRRSAPWINIVGWWVVFSVAESETMTFQQNLLHIYICIFGNVIGSVIIGYKISVIYNSMCAEGFVETILYKMYCRRK